MSNVKNLSAISQESTYSILLIISFSHFINDLLQAVIPSAYPFFKENFSLSFSQIGIISFTFQIIACILQPFIGMYTDKNSKPYSLLLGMSFIMGGLFLASIAVSFSNLLVSVSLIGVGSSIFHPEASRVAHLASGGKKGLAQSVFQLGGSAGSAISPLLVALIVIPFGQPCIIWFCLIGFVGILILWKIGMWYSSYLSFSISSLAVKEDSAHGLSSKRVTISILILLVLVFSKYFYLASISSYYTFFLIDKFHISIQQSQMYLFVFSGAVAIGTLAGGYLGDRFGRKYIIWMSILGAAPFTLLLPHVSLFWVGTLSVIIGLILSSAFSAILVFATELLPGKVGLVSGLFFGFAFGMGGLGSAVFGKLADVTSIEYVFSICGFLPILGIIAVFLPNIESRR
jgi:FSR family fosmidomycin resistance protein-like MFS transporter